MPRPDAPHQDVGCREQPTYGDVLDSAAVQRTIGARLLEPSPWTGDGSSSPLRGRERGEGVPPRRSCTAKGRVRTDTGVQKISNLNDGIAASQAVACPGTSSSRHSGRICWTGNEFEHEHDITAKATAPAFSTVGATILAVHPSGTPRDGRRGHPEAGAGNAVRFDAKPLLPRCAAGAGL